MRTQRTQENITGKKKTSWEWLCPASSSPIPILYPLSPRCSKFAVYSSRLVSSVCVCVHTDVWCGWSSQVLNPNPQTLNPRSCETLSRASGVPIGGLSVTFCPAWATV